MKIVPILFLLATAACVNPPAENLADMSAESGSEPAAASAGDGDSTYVREVAEFLADAGPAQKLSDAAASRTGLVATFAAALEQRDTVELRRLVLTRAEFGHLYYPHTRFTAAPYRLAPALLWFLIQNNSSKGIERVFQRHGGRPLGPVTVECGPEVVEGDNRLWPDCVLVHTVEGEVRRDRWFGTIMERGGAFKFVSYANDL